MTNAENVDSWASLCTICDWRPSACEDLKQGNVDNLEERKITLLARALREKLPNKFRHVICKPHPNEYSEPDVCVLKTNCMSKDDVEAWVQMYSAQSGFKWDLQPRSVSFNRKMKEVYRCKYVCRESVFENSLWENQSIAQCPASITIVVKSRQSAVADEHLNIIPTTVRLRGDHCCFSSEAQMNGMEYETNFLYLSESDSTSSSDVLKPVTGPNENGIAGVKKEIVVKKDSVFAIPVEDLPAKNSLPDHKKKIDSPSKKETRPSDGIGQSIVKAEVIQDGKVIANNGLILSKENSSRGTKRVSFSHKETLSNKGAKIPAKVKAEHSTVNGHQAVNQLPKRNFILIKGNSLPVGCNLVSVMRETKVASVTNCTEEKSQTMKTATVVRVQAAPEEKIVAPSKEKMGKPAKGKRKHEENGQNLKNKKARVDERKSSDHNVIRAEANKKKSPEKTVIEGKAIPVGHVMECTLQSAAATVRQPVSILPRPPPKVPTAVRPSVPVSRPAEKLELCANAALCVKFDELFAQKHEPATALATHLVDLQLAEGADWRAVACPDLDWCQTRYAAAVTEPLISTPQTTLSALSALSAAFGLGRSAGEPSFRLERLAGGAFAGALVTPSMRRNAASNPAAAHVLAYRGSTSQLFLVMCDSDCGGLPLAVLLVSEASECAVSAAVALLSSSTELSPRQWLVPDVPALGGALAARFPRARISLGLASLLKDTWMFALRPASGIPESHQVLLYQHVVHMIRCPTELSLLYQLQVALCSGDKSYADFLNGLYQRRAEWAVYLREPALCEDALETEIAVAKAAVFGRLHDFDTVHLVHFALTRLDKWYEQRVRSLQSGAVWDPPITTAAAADAAAEAKLTPLSEGITLVQADTEQLVNDAVGGCSCLGGRPGWCRHQQAVSAAALRPPATPPPPLRGPSVHVDASRPEIFPAGVLGSSPARVSAGPRAPPTGTPAASETGKRVRKLPPRLQVDLGALSLGKKSKGEKKKRASSGAEAVGPGLERRLSGDVTAAKGASIAVQDEAPASELDPTVDPAAADATRKSLPKKRGRPSLADAKVARPQPEKSVSSKASPNSKGTDDSVYKLIRLIGHDLPQCYARNPLLKDTICEFYRAIHAPVSKRLSLLRHRLLAKRPRPLIDLEGSGPVDVVGASNVDVAVVDIDIGVVSVDVVDACGAEEDRLVVESERAAGTAPGDIVVSPCFVSLLQLDVGKYMRADGSYRATVLRDEAGLCPGDFS